MDTAEINDHLNACLPALIVALGLHGAQNGDEFLAYNPHRVDKKLGSFSICIRGPKAGIWKDFASSDGGNGGLSLIRYILGYDWLETYNYARNFLGCPDSKKIVNFRSFEGGDGVGRRVNDPEKRKRIAQAIWIDAEKDIRNTAADKYLNGRGLDIRKLGRQPGAIRFACKCWSTGERRNFPALISAIHSNDGAFQAIHRVYLSDENGEVPDKRKAVLGSYRGGFIRIWRGVRDGKVMPAFSADNWKTDIVYVTEGVEDALAVALLKPELRIVAGVGVTNFKNLQFPECIKNIVLVADNDPAGSAGERSLQGASYDLVQKGYGVSICRSPVGKDFADAMKEMSDV